MLVASSTEIFDLGLYQPVFVFFVEKKEKDNSIKENDKEADQPEQAEVSLPNFVNLLSMEKKDQKFLLLFGSGLLPLGLFPIRPLLLHSLWVFFGTIRTFGGPKPTVD